MMSGKETAVVSRRGAGASANAADLMEVRTWCMLANTLR